MTEVVVHKAERLPASWTVAPIGEIAELGPKLDLSGFADGQPVHFVPMAAVGEDFGGIDIARLRPLNEVRKGYTAFLEGDVLFAKITPCMENGKGAIVPVLPQRIAFGSTEFHVLRPHGVIERRWLAHYLSQEEFRRVARHNMTGTAGQLRVSSKWLADAGIPIAPFREQTRIVEKLEELLSDLDAGVAELKAAQRKLALYRQSLLKAAVEGALTADWRAARSAPLSPHGRGAGGEGAISWEADNETWTHRRARELRREQTPSEHALWQQLRAKRFSGHKFRRQQPLGRYIVDFVCFSSRLIVELDGGQHADAEAYDAERDAWLKSQGFRVLRFWNNQWTVEPAAVLEAIWQALQEPPPLPNPSPTRGEEFESESGVELLQRILRERRARWEQKQLAKYAEQGKVPPKDWEAKYPEPVAPETPALPELPDGWVWATVDQLARVGTGVTPLRSKPAYFKGGMIPWVTSGALNSDVVYKAEEMVTSLAMEECRLEEFPTGSLLVAMYGEGKTRGKCSELAIPAAINQAIAAVVLEGSATEIRPFLKTYFMNAYEAMRKQASGGVQPNLNLQIIKALAVPLPPLLEQVAMSAHLDEQLIAFVDAAADTQRGFHQATAQRKNILKAAFAGQLVPQDPNDEPASVLLERIRAVRAAEGGGGAKKRGRQTKVMA